MQYLKCAKHVSYTALNSSVQQMLRMYYGQYAGYFDAGTRGAYYVDIEGTKPQSIWLVAPDNSFDFSDLATKTVADALESIATYCDSNTIPEWKELADWLSDVNFLLYIALSTVTSVKVKGLTLSNIPAWSNLNGSISKLFRWIKSLVIAAEQANGGSTISMASIRDQSNLNKFELPISAVSSNELIGEFSLTCKFQI